MNPTPRRQVKRHSRKRDIPLQISDYRGLPRVLSLPDANYIGQITDVVYNNQHNWQITIRIRRGYFAGRSLRYTLWLTSVGALRYSYMQLRRLGVPAKLLAGVVETDPITDQLLRHIGSAVNVRTRQYLATASTHTPTMTTMVYTNVNKISIIGYS